MKRGPRAATVVRLLFLVYAVCVMTAIVVQDRTRYLPLGLFNKDEHAYELLSSVALALSATLVAAFALALVRGRDNVVGRLGRGLIGSFLILEGLLYGLDAGWVSRSPASPIGGPYYEVRVAPGEWVPLRKKGAAAREYTTSSMFSYRFPQAYPLRSQAPRVLFLGDSYTEGSGSAPACNYPTVVEGTLSRALGRGVQVMNAGVAAYGPLEAARLLRLLEAKRFAFDAIVFNLYLGNDFTDDLPATERRVVAGMIFRFPVSPFLRFFHPLNSRTFRYALVVAGLAGALGNAGTPQAAGGPAPGESGPFSRQFLADMREKLELNYAIGGRGVATGVVHDAVELMRADAQRLGVPFVVVAIPDPIEASAELQAALDLPRRSHEYDLSRLERWVSAAWKPIPTIQTIAPLSSGEENYLPNDTHLNDLGNVRLGEYVGGRLAEVLRSSAAFRSGGTSGGPGASAPGAAPGVCSQPGSPRREAGSARSVRALNQPLE